jgi:mono/diheme cytochrome c family protein/plastocyanin
VFKIRSTPSGSFPTDVDLFKSISRGLVADKDMPAFKFLPERDRWAVIAYIKTLSDLWEEESEWQEDPIEVGEPPIPDAAMIVAGEQVYANMQCAECHGERGEGDGPSAAELEDDNGLPITPRDFTDASQFVGASDPQAVFQTFMTGLDGTPMPSFKDFLDEEQGWQLVWYVTSLRPEFDLQVARREMALERGEDLALLAPVGTAQPEVSEPSPAEPEVAETEQVEQARAGMEPEAATQEAEDASATVTASVAETTEEEAEEQEQMGDYEAIEVTGGGSIQGKVIYNGSVKTRTVLPTKDQQVCGKPRKEPMIVVGEGGVVQDSVVYLKEVKSGKAWPEMALKTPVLDQEHCDFRPHVQVVRQGKLDIVNSDPVLHNTHGYYGKRTAFNVALPQKGQTVTKTLKRPGTVKVDCDAHGWMLGWLKVVDNPYYHQTGADGTFSITDVPPGNYTLVVWQETLGEKEIPVTVTAGGATELDIDLTN